MLNGKRNIPLHILKQFEKIGIKLNIEEDTVEEKGEIAIKELRKHIAWYTKNLKNSSVILTDIIKDCLNLITIGFTGKTDATSAKTIINILNTYILENAVSTSELQTNMMSLRNDVDNEIDSINEYQEAQDSEILNTMLATTEIYETILMATVSVLASNEEEINNNIFGKRMISIYVTLVEKGLKTIDEIPFVIREQVKLYLQRD